MNKWFPLIIIVLFSQGANAQNILWEYEVNAPVKNIPADYWFDEEGNGYFNIRKQNPVHKNQYDQSLFLLKLNKDGLYRGSTFVNNCTSSALLLPFGEGQLMSSGYNCDSDTSKNVVDSRIFDYVGNVLAKGQGFKGNYFASIQTENGFTFFSKPTRNFSYTYLSMGYIDDDFNISHDTINLKQIEKTGLGIVNAYNDPIQMSDKSWVVPMNYGKVEGGGIGVDHGVVLGIKDANLQWSYPDTLSAYKLKHLSSNENKAAILMRKSRNYDPKLLVILDEKGNEVNHFYFRPGFSVQDLLLTKEHIILLASHKIVLYDHQGNLVSEFNFNDRNYSRPKNMKLDREGNLYFVANKYGSSVIVKMGFETLSSADEPDEIALSLDILSKGQQTISSAHFNKVSEQTLSVSVFPNPASVYINFVLKEQPSLLGSYTIQIFDATGKPMHQDTFKGNRYELFLDKYISGTYMYRIFNNSGDPSEIVSGSFIKIGT